MGHVSGAVPGRRVIRKEATRRQLLRAGRNLFSREGLYEARIEDLTADAGIAKGTLYLYFRNRDELARVVVEAGYQELQAFLTPRIARARTRDGLIRALVRAHLEFFDRNRDLVRIFHQARGMLKFGRPEWDGLRPPLAGHVRYIAESLRRVSKNGRSGGSSRRTLAVRIYGTVSGVTSMRLALDPHADLKRLGSELAFPGHPTRRAVRRVRTSDAR